MKPYGPRTDTRTRFYRHVLVDATGCWLWTGVRDRKGYGQLWCHGRTARSHRVAYELERGPIPPGLTIDHLCRNPSCVNPMHLEPVTRLENFRRGTGGNAGSRFSCLKTHCPRGHPYSEANTYRHRTHRYCRQCHNERRRKAATVFKKGTEDPE